MCTQSPTAVGIKSFHFHGQTNCDWQFVLSGFAAECPRMDKVGVAGDWWPIKPVFGLSGAVSRLLAQAPKQFEAFFYATTETQSLPPERRSVPSRDHTANRTS